MSPHPRQRWLESAFLIPARAMGTKCSLTEVRVHVFLVAEGVEHFFHVPGGRSYIFFRERSSPLSCWCFNRITCLIISEALRQTHTLLATSLLQARRQCHWVVTPSHGQENRSPDRSRQVTAQFSRRRAQWKCGVFVQISLRISRRQQQSTNRARDSDWTAVPPLPRV